MGFSFSGQGLFFSRRNKDLPQCLSFIFWGGLVLAVMEGGFMVMGWEQTAWAQSEELSETSDSLPSGPIPFAGYEERLRQSSRWQQMSDEEREQAIQKIQRVRKQFQERQRRLESQYKGLLEQSHNRRESLMQKRRRARQYKANDHWAQFQALPIQKRLEMEKALGLNRVPPSQKRKEFSQSLERLPYSKKQKVLQDIGGKVR